MIFELKERDLQFVEDVAMLEADETKVVLRAVGDLGLQPDSAAGEGEQSAGHITYGRGRDEWRMLLSLCLTVDFFEIFKVLHDDVEVLLDVAKIGYHPGESRGHQHEAVDVGGTSLGDALLRRHGGSDELMVVVVVEVGEGRKTRVLRDI